MVLYYVYIQKVFVSHENTAISAAFFVSGKPL